MRPQAAGPGSQSNQQLMPLENLPVPLIILFSTFNLSPLLPFFLRNDYRSVPDYTCLSTVFKIKNIAPFTPGENNLNSYS
jgi:hypothetical protein